MMHSITEDTMKVQLKDAIKEKLKKMGADLVGVASIDRFEKAPQGFHPKDLMHNCQSVIVLARRFPHSVLKSENTIPYTVIRNAISARMDSLALDACIYLEDLGYEAVPSGCIGPSVSDVRTGRDRGAISLKHSAQAAGLGVIGKNTLLITPEYGNMVWLQVLVTNIYLEPDPLLQKNYCKDSCNLCIKKCPAGALGNSEMDQWACWNYAFKTSEGDDFYIKCHKCRSLCPYSMGEKRF